MDWVPIFVSLVYEVASVFNSQVATKKAKATEKKIYRKSSTI